MPSRLDAKPLPLEPGRSRRSTGNTTPAAVMSPRAAARSLHRAVVEHVRLDALGPVGGSRVPSTLAKRSRSQPVDSCAPAELAQADQHRLDRAAILAARPPAPGRQGVERREPARGQTGLGEHGAGLPREALGAGDAEEHAPGQGQLLGLLEPAQEVAALRCVEPPREHRGEGAPEVGLGPGASEGGGSARPFSSSGWAISSWVSSSPRAHSAAGWSAARGARPAAR